MKGFLIGRPLQFGQKFGELDQYRAVTDLLGKYNVPIVMDLDIGHLHPAMPLIVGSYAKVAAEEMRLKLRWSAVRTAFEKYFLERRAEPVGKCLRA